jgi:hypothetical protein
MRREIRYWYFPVIFVALARNQLRRMRAAAEQIPPGYPRADDHPSMRKTKISRAGDPDAKSARGLNACSE